MTLRQRAHGARGGMSWTILKRRPRRRSGQQQPLHQPTYQTPLRLKSIPPCGPPRTPHRATSPLGPASPHTPQPTPHLTRLNPRPIDSIKSTPMAGHTTSQRRGSNNGNSSGRSSNMNCNNVGTLTTTLVAPPPQNNRQASWLEPAEPTEGEQK